MCKELRSQTRGVWCNPLLLLLIRHAQNLLKVGPSEVVLHQELVRVHIGWGALVAQELVDGLDLA